MSYASFIARRYFQATRRKGFISFISAIAITGVALGTTALIVALSVLGGFEKEITDKVIGFNSHIQVSGFQNTPLQNYRSTSRRIASLSPLIESVQPYVGREALIRSGDVNDGIFLKGVDTAGDFSSIGKYIVRGSYSLGRTDGSLPHIIIGKKLAGKLQVDIGAKVTVFGMSPENDLGQMKVKQFTVAGIYESGMAEYDDVFAFASLRDAQSLFDYGESVAGYDIWISNRDSTAALSERIQSTLRYPHYSRTFFQNYRNLFSWIELQKRPVPIILGLIIIVATVNIIGTLLMVVLGKTREIGILKSLGASRKGITGIFVRQGLWIGVTGSLIGNVFSFGLCSAEAQYHFFSLPSDIYFMSSVPILLRPEYFVIVTVITLTLCLACSLIPAWLAARVEPVRAIRFV